MGGDTTSIPVPFPGAVTVTHEGERDRNATCGFGGQSQGWGTELAPGMVQGVGGCPGGTGTVQQHLMGPRWGDQELTPVPHLFHLHLLPWAHRELGWGVLHRWGPPHMGVTHPNPPAGQSQEQPGWRTRMGPLHGADSAPHVLLVTPVYASTCATEAATREEPPKRGTLGIGVPPATGTGTGIQQTGTGITVTAGQAAAGGPAWPRPLSSSSRAAPGP